MYVTNVAILWFGGQVVWLADWAVVKLTELDELRIAYHELHMISGVFLLTARAITSVRRIGEILSEPAIDLRTWFDRR